MGIWDQVTPVVERVLQPQVLEQHSTRFSNQMPSTQHPAPSSQLPALSFQLPVTSYQFPIPFSISSCWYYQSNLLGNSPRCQTRVSDKADKAYTKAAELEVGGPMAGRLRLEQPSCASTGGNLTVLRRAGPVSQPCAVDANGRVRFTEK
ncbi:hypothetical protein M5D96_004302 [Drosophila gunungcola]|uniref:Uncharacterized protein n=1 Tax=Drosophila gunungcola TaxID=103775 RepID=A0A9P9YTR7_9MUSC|nr:hypothetical protein M5D96_004302 [Drosophila gunungcola]